MELGLTFGGGESTAPLPRRIPAAATDDDAGLIDCVAAGDAQALAILYDRHGRGVYSMALRLLGDSPAAEEVVQETFLKLWRQPTAYQPTRGRLLPWLLGVAHHHAVDLLRRRQLEQRHRAPTTVSANGDSLTEVLDNLGISSTDDDPQLRAGAVEQRAVVGQALHKLSREQRLPLELAYFNGLTQLEIATLLGLPLGTIKTRMRLGLQQLRKAPELADLWSER